MKYFICLISLLRFIMNVYGQERTVKETDLEDRNGLLYEKNSSIPFSGKSLVYISINENDSIIEYLDRERLLKNGLTNNYATSFYPEGLVHKQFYYNNGIINGICRIYNREGTIQTKVLTKNGIVLRISTFEKNETIEDEKIYTLDKRINIPNTFDEISATDGFLNGVAKIFYKNGNTKLEVVLDMGLVNGDYKTYYNNGQLHEIYPFKVGILSGLYQKYNKKGKLIEEATYKEGKKRTCTKSNIKKRAK